jgi:hypothetical protein
MKNVGRCVVTREKVIMLLNGMFQIKKKEQSEAVSVAAFLDTTTSLEVSPLRAAVAQVTLHLRFSQQMLRGSGVWSLESPGRERCTYSLVDSHGSFREACCFHLQGGPISFRGGGGRDRGSRAFLELYE